MPSPTLSKLPSLEVFLSRNKEAFEVAVRLGIPKTTWDEQAELLTAEYKHMKRMNRTELKVYLQNRQKRESPALLALREQLDKLINAGHAREKLSESVQDAKAEANFNSKKKKR